MISRFILRCLTIFVAATIMGPLMFGCAAPAAGMWRVDFTGYKPEAGADMFVCGYLEKFGPDVPLQCVDMLTYMEAQKRVAAPPEGSSHEL